MQKYLNPTLVSEAFGRLASRNTTGKSHLERTSALMVFLSMDAMHKHFAVERLNFSPACLEGRNNRKQLQLEFTKLVLVGHRHGRVMQVIELGKVDEGGPNPDTRLSSNFLTVPLKKASELAGPLLYPRRPNAPLLVLGGTTPEDKWAVAYHGDWRDHFLKMLTSVTSATPMRDLAIFVCRDCGIDAKSTDLFEVLGMKLADRFTAGLSDYWRQRIEKERPFAQNFDGSFVEQYISFSVPSVSREGRIRQYDGWNKSDLIARIRQLESGLGTAE
jgi:hypothetical protein